MKLRTKVAAALTALALAAVPATVVANPPADPGNGNGNGPDYTPAPEKSATPGPHASLPEKANAYGVYCRGESKKHVAGEKGTPFSQCVTAMAKLAKHEVTNPARACKAESKKHVAGQKGTPFSQCVRAAARMKHAS